MASQITNLSFALAEEGRQHNSHLQSRFNREWEQIDVSHIPCIDKVPEEHRLFLQAVAESLSWLQDSVDNRELAQKFLEEYFRILVWCTIAERTLLEVRRRIEDRFPNPPKVEGKGQTKNLIPKRLTAIIAGLESWAQVSLPAVHEGQQLDLEEIQRRAIYVNKGVRWSSLAAVKMYAIQNDGDTNNKKIVLSRSIYPPMGRAVSRGIERLFGFSLGESKGDHEIAKDLHLKLAELTGESVFDLNSGFYKIGGGL